MEKKEFGRNEVVVQPQVMALGGVPYPESNTKGHHSMVHVEKVLNKICPGVGGSEGWPLRRVYARGRRDPLSLFSLPPSLYWLTSGTYMHVKGGRTSEDKVPKSAGKFSFDVRKRLGNVLLIR